MGRRNDKAVRVTYWRPLRVCRFKGRLVSLDNRRLYCMKELQKERSEEDILVRVHVVELNNFLETFFSHMENGQEWSSTSYVGSRSQTTTRI